MDGGDFSYLGIEKKKLQVKRKERGGKVEI